MKLGIVGHAAEKFTPHTEHLARLAIGDLIDRHGPKVIVSGRSPMGGVDVWAEEIAEQRDIPALIFPPKTAAWNAPGGFKDRNLKIARHSDLVACVVVKELPPGYTGMKFGICYHCVKNSPDLDFPPHVKSGGCWTAWKARSQEWVVI